MEYFDCRVQEGNGYKPPVWAVSDCQHVVSHLQGLLQNDADSWLFLYIGTYVSINALFEIQLDSLHLVSVGPDVVFEVPELDLFVGATCSHPQFAGFHMDRPYRSGVSFDGLDE